MSPRDAFGEPHSRRAFLTGATRAGLALGALGPLAACSQNGSAAVTSGGPPRRGGRLRVGMVSGGKSESFNPATGGNTIINLAMVSALFEGLVRAAPDLSLQPALASSWQHNADATAWEFRLRDGVTWHDGKPFTADDVIYSMHWMAKPGNGSQGSVANVDLARLKRKSATTVVIPLKEPDLQFPSAMAVCWIVQDGAKDFTHPIGTGPFRFQSLSPGQQSVSTRNPHYWEHGKPYVDALVIESIADDTARLNALMAGQIDVMAQIPFVQAKAQQSQGQIKLISSTGTTSYMFYMRVDQPPFSDARVRQAMRLLVDRQAMVDDVLSGFGSVANDLVGMGVPYYDSSLPQRAVDIDQAKSLLAKAGHGSGLTVTLQTSPVGPGVVESATLLADQAAKAGVHINVSQVSATSYFDPTLSYLKMPFAQSIWTGVLNLNSFYPYAIQSNGGYNETHWKDPHTDALIAKATQATTDAAATSAWQAVQRQQWEDGGYVIWANVNNVDATSTRVAGITPSRYLPLGLPTGFTDAYFAG